MAVTPERIDVRAASELDHAEIIELAAATLGWEVGRPNEALFTWKHLDNVFGQSQMWIAEVEGRLAAFRSIMRWEFEGADGRVVRAGRAVDTATHVDFQGAGLFTRLTLHALEELRAAGDTGFIFNTPNDKSRPGYLKMGWIELGRVPVGIRLGGAGGALRTARARVPAEKWSAASSAGSDATAVMNDDGPLVDLLASQPAPSRWRTRRSPAYLRWRYAAGPISYRAVLRSSKVEDGVALFRVRRRGAATETALCDVIVPDDDRRARLELVRKTLRATRTDYLIAVDDRAVRLVPLPGQGPRLTWRAVGCDDAPSMQSFDLRLGDIELF